jgi:hypothetical protein
VAHSFPAPIHPAARCSACGCALLPLRHRASCQAVLHPGDAPTWGCCGTGPCSASSSTKGQELLVWITLMLCVWRLLQKQRCLSMLLSQSSPLKGHLPLEPAPSGCAARCYCFSVVLLCCCSTRRSPVSVLQAAHEHPTGILSCWTIARHAATLQRRHRLVHYPACPPLKLPLLLC